MQTNTDFRDLFAELNAAGAEYLVVGAYALAAHGHVRATKDLDQIGIPPVRVDVITSIDGVDFEAAWRERMVSSYSDQPVSVLSRRHLIENKKAPGRLQDLADVEFLEKGERD